MLATASDLRIFFTTVDKEPGDVGVDDMLGFITAQGIPVSDPKIIRIRDGESGLSAATIKRRLSLLSGLFGYLVMTGEREANPVPRGLAEVPFPTGVQCNGEGQAR